MINHLKKHRKLCKKPNKKGFAMSLVVAYMYVIVVLSGVVITLALTGIQYTGKMRASAIDNMELDAIGYDFAIDGIINEADYPSYNLTAMSEDKNTLYVQKHFKDDNDNPIDYVVLTVTRNDMSKILTWYYGYVEKWWIIFLF